MVGVGGEGVFGAIREAVVVGVVVEGIEVAGEFGFIKDAVVIGIVVVGVGGEGVFFRVGEAVSIGIDIGDEGAPEVAGGGCAIGEAGSGDGGVLVF